MNISKNTPQKLRFSNSNQALFYTTLRQRVGDYFKENGLNQYGDHHLGIKIKTALMLGLFIVPYCLILSGWFSVWAMFGLVLLMATGTAGIGLSVMHDAIHGSYSSRPLINRALSWSLYILGGNVFSWRIQHNVLHHTYTNVYEYDEDIETKFVLRLSPHSPLKKYHKYQHIYVFLLYPLMTLSIFYKDFAKVFRYASKNFYPKNNANLFWEAITLIFTKVLYIFMLCILPYLVLEIAWWQVLIGFLSLHFVVGLVLSLIFQMAHVIEDTIHPTYDEEGNLENSWAIHQLYTTANFAKNNHFLTWFAGGLNYQVEHHLFPNICHIHYRPISEIVKNTAQEFGLPYHEQPTFVSALRSHIKMLHQLGKVPPILGNCE